MDIDKCNIYFGNLKIKTIYFGQYKVYEDSAKRELTLLEFGDAIITTNYVAPKFTNIVDTNPLTLLQFGESIVTTQYVAPSQSIIVDTNTISLLKFSEV